MKMIMAEDTGHLKSFTTDKEISSSLYSLMDSRGSLTGGLGSA